MGKVILSPEKRELMKKKMSIKAKQRMTGKFGKDHNLSKSVIAFEIMGGKVQEFESIRLAAEWLKKNGYPKANHTNIVRMLKGKRPTAYGYVWSYKQKDKIPH